jgi:small-conductance mechanosensitive channel
MPEKSPFQLPAFLQDVYLGNTLQNWILAAVATIAALVLLTIVRTVLKSRVGGYLAGRSQNFAAFAGRLLQRTSSLLVLVLSIWFGCRFLTLGDGVLKLVDIALVVGISLQALWWLLEALEFGLQTFLQRRRDQLGNDDPGLATAAPAIRFLGRLVVVVVVALLALQNLGIDVTAMIAGLGVGGIAIALAVQNILGDLFASMSIVLDKPFVVGDFIVVGDRAGSVEKIGLKTTRLRSISGEQLIFANSDLLGSRIQNFKRMQERRALFAVGVTYQTPLDVVEAIPQLLRESIEAQAKARFDRAHFKSFGASSLDFECVYWVLEPEYNTFMDVQQAINLAIARRFEERGIEFAYPTQTLFLTREAKDAS